MSARRLPPEEFERSQQERKRNPRRGRALTVEERTEAVLRVIVDGESTEIVGAEIRIARATLGQWCKQWRRRESYWSGALSAIEQLRGCYLEIDDDYDPPRIKALVGPPPSGAEAEELRVKRDAEARELFVENLSDPTCDEDVLLRAWRGLSEHDRKLFSPAWDARLLVAEQLAEGYRRVQAALAAVA
ncbi:MAG: hypothetical protein KF773_26425 [Deltaproteobacteria bacterium]|nr:hypothetical protein [Deltaproteobacteria bacterium]